MAQRKRTYTWDDPLQTAAKALQMPGIDFLQAIIDGGIPAPPATTILDSAMGCALHSTLQQGLGYTTLKLKVNFLKAVNTKTGELTATGKLIQSGSRIALTKAQLTDAQGNIYAHATSTCMLLKKEG